DDVGLIHFHFRRDDGHVGKRHQEAAVGVLNSGNDIVADTLGEIADDAVDRRRVGGLVQDVLGVNQHGLALAQLRAHLIQRGLQLQDAGFGGVDGGELRIVGGLALIEILLGNQAALIEALSALPFDLGVFQIGLLL